MVSHSLFVRRSINVTFANLVIEKCTFDGADGVQAVIDVAECHSENAYGIVALHSVIFRENSLIAASGLRMSSSSCYEVEMIEVEISENVCSGEACGVHLARKNRLENCVAHGNRIAKTNEQQSSLLHGKISSNTSIKGFTANENDLTIIKLQEASLTMMNASFRQNHLSTRITEATRTHYIHLEDSVAEFKNTKATANNAQNYGGFLLALRSTLLLERTRNERVKQQREGRRILVGSRFERDTRAYECKRQQSTRVWRILVCAEVDAEAERDERVKQHREGGRIHKCSRLKRDARAYECKRQQCTRVWRILVCAEVGAEAERDKCVQQQREGRRILVGADVGAEAERDKCVQQQREGRRILVGRRFERDTRAYECKRQQSTREWRILVGADVGAEAERDECVQQQREGRRILVGSRFERDARAYECKRQQSTRVWRILVGADVGGEAERDECVQQQREGRRILVGSRFERDARAYECKRQQSTRVWRILVCAEVDAEAERDERVKQHREGGRIHKCSRLKRDARAYECKRQQCTRVWRILVCAEVGAEAERDKCKRATTARGKADSCRR